MPGQEQQRAVLAVGGQRQPVQPGIEGVTAVVTQAVRRRESIPQIRQLGSAQRRNAFPYPQPNPLGRVPSPPCRRQRLIISYKGPPFTDSLAGVNANSGLCLSSLYHRLRNTQPWRGHLCTSDANIRT